MIFAWPSPARRLVCAAFLVAGVWPMKSQAADLPYVFLRKFGKKGSGMGEFLYPQGIVVDRNRNIYVADYGNHRIQKFSTTGTFVREWGEYGNGTGQFNGPTSLAIDPSNTLSNIFVADTLNYRVQKFNRNGSFIYQLGEKGPFGVFPPPDGKYAGYPYGVAVNLAGSVYVCDTGRPGLLLWDAGGDYVTTILGPPGAGSLSQPRYLTLDPDEFMFIVDTVENKIKKYNGSGAFVSSFGKLGDKDGEFRASGIGGIAIDAKGNVFVVDTVHSRVQKFDLVGNFKTNFGSLGNDDGELNNPVGVAVDLKGHVYVTDTAANHRIVVYTPPPPPVPTNFMGTVLSTGSVRWTWTDNAVTELTYYVEKMAKLPTAETFFVDKVLVILAPDTQEWVETGLTANQQCYRRATVEDEATTSSSNLVTLYTFANPPTALTVAGQSSSRVTLSWSGNGGTQYGLYRKVVGTPGTLTLIADWEAKIVASDFVDGGLTSATSYEYQVAAYNGDRVLTAPTTSVTAITAPAPPGLPVAGSQWIGGLGVTYTWTASPTPAVTGYIVEVGTAPNASDIIRRPVGLSLSLVVVGLADGVKYYIRVQAVDDQGKLSDFALDEIGVGVDITAPPVPTVNLVSHPLAGVTYSSAALEMSLVALTDFSGIAAYSVDLDASATATPSASTVIVGTATALTLNLPGDGAYVVTVFARDGASNVSGISRLTCYQKAAVSASGDNPFRFGDGSGVFIPTGALSSDTRLKVSFPAAAPTSIFQSARLKLSRKFVDMQLADGTRTFGKSITVTLAYADGDVAGLDPSLLVLAYFDTSRSAWVPLPASGRSVSQKRVWAAVDHFTVFILAEMAVGGATIAQAYNFPNPFSPEAGTTIRYELSEAVSSVAVKIFRVSGELVRELPAPLVVGVNDLAWDGRDRFGQKVLSEVLIGLVEAVKSDGSKARQSFKMMGWNP